MNGGKYSTASTTTPLILGEGRRAPVTHRQPIGSAFLDRRVLAQAEHGYKRELLLLFPTSTVSEQQQTELVTKIEASTLDLAVITQIDAGARLYEQRNVRSLRKQVQPVLEEVIKAVYA
ncbi:uncharacterized protein EV422DRAFT_570261 [Fimicolochytrium jonesii]|uniref:uncharacterized protein n=1 Tax=Fimicolochytrium jonesii TaxID=1396493 RepID=UPI0022FE9387|nr:uncharacterized protein EV422DRAFT_570261 [Fimicolochytrium jonesii]KAI8817790.1 hypothetical protein EV422DRAFT_570261 [Fimicolochytrium jonesii]